MTLGKWLMFLLIPVSISDPIRIEESTENVDILESNAYKCYFAVLTSKSSVNIAVQPMFGDSNLFVSLISSPQNTSTCKPPSASTYEFSSMQAITLESVHISEQRLSSCTLPCQINIAINCLSNTCGFILFYDQGLPLILQKNVAVQGFTSANSYSYYRYYRDSKSPLLVLLTVLGSSNPDLYIAEGLIPLKNNATWFSNTMGGETLIINNGKPGLYYIGVYCETKSEFTLTVTTDIEPLFMLQSGLPQFMTITKAKRNNFYFWSHSSYEIQLKVSVLFGKVTMLANPQDPVLEEIYGKIPTQSSFTWKSFDLENDEYSISIKPSDSKFCVNCNIVISVIAIEDSEYSIVANNEQFLEILQSGIPSHGLVQKNKLDSYMFTLDTLNEIEIRVIVYSGDVDLYVDTSTPVSSQFYKWRSNSLYNEEIIEIPVSDKGWVLGNYFIAVEGWKTSSYSITVFSNNMTSTIVPGLFHEYSLVKPMSFYLNIAENTKYTCVITSFEEHFKPFIFVNIAKNKPEVPTSRSNQIAYNQEDMYDDLLSTFSFDFFSVTEPKIAAIAFSNNVISKNPNFSFGCYTPLSVIKLTEHSYNMYKLESNHKEFEIFTSGQNPVKISLKFCFGLVKLDVSKNPHTYSSDPETIIYYFRDGITARILNPSGRYYLRVTGEPSDCFELFTEVIHSEFNIEITGKIEYKEEKNKIKVTWPVPFINGKKSEERLKYFLFYSPFYRSEINSACGMRLLGKENTTYSLRELTENYAEIEQDHGFINVIAYFGRHKQDPQGFTVYEPIEFTTCKDCNSVETTNYKGAIFLFLFIAIVCIVIYTLYKRSQRNRPYQVSGNYELSNF